MDLESRLNLERMIKEYKPEETTDKIRTLKHSQKIHQDVERMLKIQKDYKRLDFKTQERMIQKQCNFLYTHYFNLFNRFLKKELDLNILYKLILTLQKIENGELNLRKPNQKGSPLVRAGSALLLLDPQKVRYHYGELVPCPR